MRKRMGILITILLLSCTYCCHAAEGKTMYKLSWENTAPFHDGQFQGWGTSLCWWANRLGYSDTLTQKAAEALCDKDVGLGLNILRYNIGGGDDPSHDHITRTDSMMPGFWKDPVWNAATGSYSWEYDWDQDENQRNVLNACLRVGGEDVIVEAFSNSPPYFLTRSGCSSGAERAFQDNLLEGAEDAFASYLADVALHFQDAWGIHFESISPMNEPDSSYWGSMSPKQEGCHFSAGIQQSKMLVALQKALQERNLHETFVAGTDETSIDVQAVSLSKLSDDAMNALDRVDTHTYGGNNREFLKNLTLRYGKNLWMSEVDGGSTLGAQAGEMGAGLWLADEIMKDLNELQPSAWVLWQAIDNHISKDGYLGRTDSGMVDLHSGYWGVAVADHDQEKILLTQKYYVLGQFTRYIRPGSILFGLQGSAVAAYDPQEGALIFVAMNASAEDEVISFDWTSLSRGGAYNLFVPMRTVATGYRTSGSLQDGEHWSQIPDTLCDGQSITVVSKALSVTTWIVPCQEK